MATNKERAQNDLNVDPALPSGHIPVITTLPDSIYRHNISDEELEMFGSNHLGKLWEIKLTALGVAIGSISSAISSVYGAFWAEKEVAIGVAALINIVLLFGSAAIFFVCWYVGKDQKGSIDEKIDEIRSRTKKQETGSGQPMHWNRSEL